ncbi:MULTISPECIES: hypothetical protein [unclassified Bradyrhizobium]|uniref:hypothetical protein n=1 Tax=Bradyrhizobium TaxID=374 RepID=UPI0028E8D3F7|nr:MULTISPECIES: hypothetical protein [unclassified Bradyrhizobium]
MNLQDCRDAFATYSGKVSDICRHLGLTGVVIIWTFKKDVTGRSAIPRELLIPLLLIACGLLADLLQYFLGAIIWFLYYRKQEIVGIKENEDFRHTPLLDLPMHILFLLKAVLLAVAYGYIASYFYRAISFS